MKNHGLFLLLALISTISFAQDPIRLELDSTFFSESPDQSQISGNLILNITPTLSAAQSFASGQTGKLVRISINAKPFAGGTSNLTATISDGDQPGGAPLSTTTVAVSGAAYQDHDVLFPDSIDLIAGNKYFFHLSHSSGESLQWKRSNSNPYAAGQGFYNSGSWTSQPNDDYRFITYIAQEQSQTTTVLSITADEKVRIKDYLLPEEDGMANQIMQTDGAGNLDWVDPTVGTAALDKITDSDDDTKILVEGNADDDLIRMITDGVERIQVDAHQIKTLNNGESVFLGSGAGANDDLNNNRNVMVGDSAGISSVTGKRNVLLGHGAGKSGNKNGSVMIGFQAGASETSDDRLYINNQDDNKNEALIYGEFDNDLMRVNATLEVLTQNMVDGIKVVGDPTNNKTHLLLENNNTEGQAYELFSSGGTAPVGQSKFVIRNFSQGRNDIILDNLGRVGIGEENPSDVLEVAANDDFQGISIKGGNSNHNVELELDNNATGGRKYNLRSTGDNASQGGGKFIIRDATAGSSRLIIDQNGNVGIGLINPSTDLEVNNEFKVSDPSGTGFVRMSGVGNAASLNLNNSSSDETIALISDYFGNGGAVLVKSQGSVNAIPILLLANYQDSGYGRIITDEIQIKGGSDLAEMFEVNGKNIEPGYLVSIDENNIGGLKITDAKYDKKIIGIISGANGIRPGMMMGQSGTIADGEFPIAMSGRVYAFASDENGKIQPGDLLTSDAEGKVIKAKRKKKGAIIGKAMSPMDEKGMVLVLISLQ